MKIKVHYEPTGARSRVILHAWDSNGWDQNFPGNLAVDGTFEFELEASSRHRDISFKYYFPDEQERCEPDDYIRMLPKRRHWLTTMHIWTFDYTARCMLKPPYSKLPPKMIKIHLSVVGDFASGKMFVWNSNNSSNELISEVSRDPSLGISYYVLPIHAWMECGFYFKLARDVNDEYEYEPDNLNMVWRPGDGGVMRERRKTPHSWPDRLKQEHRFRQQRRLQRGILIYMFLGLVGNFLFFVTRYGLTIFPAIIVLIVFPLILLFLWKAPQRQTAKLGLVGKERVDTENSTRSSLGQMFAGSFFLITAYLSWQANHNTYETAQLTNSMAQRRDFNDRFAKAVETLANDKTTSRYGAIYIIEQLSTNSFEDFKRCTTILSSFLQDQRPWPPQPMKQINLIETGKSRVPGDIQLTVNVLLQNRRSEALNNERTIRKTQPLSNPFYSLISSLQGSDYHMMDTENEANEYYIALKNIDFRSIQISGNKQEVASYDSVTDRVVYRYQNVIKQVSFAGSCFRGAPLVDIKFDRVDFAGAYLEGAFFSKSDNFFEVSFKGAHLEGAHLEDTDLANVDFTGTHLEGAFLRGVANLNPDQIKVAYIDKKTVLPKNVVESLHLHNSTQ